MANSGNQKIKLLYVMEILSRESDEEHPLTAADIIDRLGKFGIDAERKSIYRDIQVLQEYGLSIEKSEENNGFYLATRDFELPELKLLADAVTASKFITEKKARDLVAKIERLGSAYQEKHLHRQVVVSDRIKTANEQIYYAIDEIYNCIDNHRKMTFRYVEWNEKKEQVFRHGGKSYVVSPAFLLWDNEYYYLVAIDEQSQEIRHYRVDKIRNAEEMDEAADKKCGQISKEDYAKKRFSMFAGESKTVRLRAPKNMAGVMIDRFGTEVTMRPEGEDIIVRTEVEVSEPFFGWITGLGGKVKITAPEEVRQRYVDFLSAIRDSYKE